MQKQKALAKTYAIVLLAIIIVAAVAGAFYYWQTTQTTEKITLKVLEVGYPQQNNATMEIIKEFMKNNPNVEILYENTGWADVITKIATASAAGDAYDLINGGSTENQWAIQSKGLLQPITDVIADLGGTNHFYPEYLVKYKNEYWMAPWWSTTLHYQYRKDLFQAKNLSEPKTWDEFLNVVRVLTEDTNGDGKIDRYGHLEIMSRYYFTSVLFHGLLLSDGGSILNPAGNETTFNSPQTIETLQFMKDLYAYTPPGSAEYGSSELISLIFEDKVAMAMCSTLTCVTQMEAKSEYFGKVDIFAIPARTSGQKPVSRMTAGFFSIGAATKGEKLEAAKKFMKFRFQTENAIKVHLAMPATQIIPIKPVYESAQIWDAPLYKKYETIFRKYNEIGRLYGRETAVLEHVGIVNPKVSEILGELVVADCMQEVILAGKSIPETVQKYTEIIKVLL